MLDQIKNNISNSISSKYNEILLDLEKIFEKIKKELISKKKENLDNLKSLGNRKSTFDPWICMDCDLYRIIKTN